MERVPRMRKKREVSMATKPHTTSSKLLVQQKDKAGLRNGLYTIDFKSCDRKYVGQS